MSIYGLVSSSNGELYFSGEGIFHSTVFIKSLGVLYSEGIKFSGNVKGGMTNINIEVLRDNKIEVLKNNKQE